MFRNILSKGRGFYFSSFVLAQRTIFIRLKEMEVSDSELGNKMHRAIKFCYHLCKTALDTVKLM